MSHPARRILDQALALVRGLPTTGDHVAEWNGYAIQQGWDEFVVVQPVEETPIPEDASQETDAVKLGVRVTVAASDPEARDQALLEMREAMAHGSDYFEWTGTTFDPPDTSGDHPIFAASSTFEVLYQHDPSSPASEQ